MDKIDIRPFIHSGKKRRGRFEVQSVPTDMGQLQVRFDLIYRTRHEMKPRQGAHLGTAGHQQLHTETNTEDGLMFRLTAQNRGQPALLQL